MHATHYQDWPNTTWNFSNPTRTDRAYLMITDEDGNTLNPTKTKVTRHNISLTFATESCGQVLVTDCMDEGI